MPHNRSLHPLLHKPLHQIRAQYVPPKSLLLQQLEMLQRRTGIRKILDIGRSRPVLQVIEVRDELGFGKVFLRGEVVEVVRVRETLDELESKSLQLAFNTVLQAFETG